MPGIEFLLGLRVVDRDDDTHDPAAVINTPCVPADGWDVDDEHTVASYPGNEQYADDAPVAVVVVPDEIDAHGLAVDEAPLNLTELTSQGVSFFAFPTPRLQIVGDGDEADIAHVPPAALNPSPYHDRTFDAAATAAFIADVRTAETMGLLTARKTPDGLELVDGHNRAWVARQAGLDTVAVHVLDLDDEAAAEAYARAHGLDPADRSPPVEELQPTLQQLEERLGDVAEVSVDQDGNGPVLAVEKLGQRYVVTAEGDVQGDGALRDRIAGVVAEVVG